MVVEDVSKKYCLCVGFGVDDMSGDDCRSRWYLVDLPQGGEEEEVEVEVEVDNHKNFEGPAGCPRDFSFASLGSTLYLVGGVERNPEAVIDESDELLIRIGIKLPGNKYPSRLVYSYDVVGVGVGVEGRRCWVRQGNLNIPRRCPTVVVSPPEYQDRRVYCFGTNYYAEVMGETCYGEVFKPSASGSDLGTCSPLDAPIPVHNDDAHFMKPCCNMVTNAGFATLDGNRYLIVNTRHKTSYYNLDAQEWTNLDIPHHQLLWRLHFGSPQAIVVDNFWYACDPYDGFVFAQHLKPSIIFDFQMEVHTLDFKDGDLYSLRDFTHHLVQIDAKTMCRVSFRKSALEEPKIVRCLKFQVVQQPDGSLCASNISRNSFTFPAQYAQYAIGCVVLKCRNRNTVI